MPTSPVKPASCISLTDAACLLQVGRNRLFAVLRSRGILSPQNLPHHKYVSAGLLRVDIKMHKLAGHNIARWYTQTTVTPAGLSWLAQMIEQQGITPAPTQICRRNTGTENPRSVGCSTVKRTRTSARTDCLAHRKCLAVAQSLTDQRATK